MASAPPTNPPPREDTDMTEDPTAATGQQGQTTANNRANAGGASAEMGDQGEAYYGDGNLNGSTTEEVLDASWFTHSFRKLNESWSER